MHAHTIVIIIISSMIMIRRSTIVQLVMNHMANCTAIKFVLALTTKLQLNIIQK